MNSDDFTNGCSIKCDDCKRDVDDWIEIVPFFRLCIPCAQKVMRRTFEDLIEYHNKDTKSKHYSLLKIMYHGEDMLNPPQKRKVSEFM